MHVNSTCSYLKKNYYHFDYRDEVLDEISSLFDWNLKQKYKSLSEISLNEEDLNFELLDVYKKLPGDYYFRIKEMKLKLTVLPDEVALAKGTCDNAYFDDECRIIGFAIRMANPSVLAHELGHALATVGCGGKLYEQT